MTLGSAILVLGVSAAPIAELRGGIPLALTQGWSPAAAYLLAVVGNLLVVPLLWTVLEVGETMLLRWRPTGALLRWLFARTRRKARWIERWGPAALMLLVAIPLPITGAWTGTVAARVFGVPMRSAFVWIALGVLIAGVVVLLASLGVFELLGIG